MLKTRWLTAVGRPRKVKTIKLLSGNNEGFLAEKDQLLVTGLEVSRFITVDDSGARHQGNE